MDSWFTALLSFSNWAIGTKLGLTIYFSLNFFLFGFFYLVDGVEVDGVFSLGMFFSGLWSLAWFLVVVGFLGDGVFLGGDFSNVVSVRGFGSFIRDGGGVCVGDLGGDMLGETDEVFEGDGKVDGSSSSMVVGLTLRESLMTSGSSKLVTLGFGMSNQTVLGFLLDEVVSSVASLYA